MRKILILVLPGLALAISALLLSGGLHSKPKLHRVQLSWHAPSPIGGVAVVGYKVYRSTMAGGPYVLLASGVAGLTYTDQVVNPATTYHYVVTSIDQNGRESRFSLEITAVIP